MDDVLVSRPGAYVDEDGAFGRGGRHNLVEVIYLAYEDEVADAEGRDHALGDDDHQGVLGSQCRP